jgi:hypothetical protein
VSGAASGRKVRRRRRRERQPSCDFCAARGDGGDWVGLARRFGGGVFADDPGAAAVVAAQLELFGWFATGERWPLTQAPPEQPR